MVYDSNIKKKEIITENNLVKKNCHVYITFKDNSIHLFKGFSLKNAYEIPFVKYTIKETDMRIKTATLTTVDQIDLTMGTVVVKIVSTLHENFIGEILNSEYEENKDGTYTYQLQDMSREYQTKNGMIIRKAPIYDVLKICLTRNHVDRKFALSGLRPIEMYEQSQWGNYVKMNTMKYKVPMIIRDKSYIEIIRDLTIGYMRYIDVYFNENGIIQIEPFSVQDWQNTGLYLTTDEVASRKFKFDITNSITDVIVQSQDALKLGKFYDSKDLFKMDLAVFFGTNITSISNPNKNENNNTSNSSSNNNSTATATGVKTDNPYGTKKKYLLIDGDGGETKAFFEAIAKPIRKAGWTVEIGGIGPKWHSIDYKKVKNGCYMTVMNGLCAGSIREWKYDYYLGKIKKNGSVFCPAWDSRTFKNRGMKKYELDLTGIKFLKRAWDDNFSPRSFKGISNPHKFMTDLGIKYCIAPSAETIAEQFLCGGWNAWKNNRS